MTNVIQLRPIVMFAIYRKPPGIQEQKDMEVINFNY